MYLIIISQLNFYNSKLKIPYKISLENKMLIMFKLSIDLVGGWSLRVRAYNLANTVILQVCNFYVKDCNMLYRRVTCDAKCHLLCDELIL